MAWELLPTNYTDASWSGLKKYNEVTNPDGTVSFQDVTQYTDKENSFFGAMDANRMNEALNVIMSMVESGTDLYTDFQNYFALQKSLFEQTATETQDGFTEYVDALKAEGDSTIQTIKTDYRQEIDTFEKQQEELFTTWFEFIKGQLSDDVAGKLQNKIDYLDTKTDGFESRSTGFSDDGNTITEIYGDKKIVTEFVSDSQIIQKLYKNELLISTKNITFSGDGKSIEEVVS